MPFTAASVSRVTVRSTSVPGSDCSKFNVTPSSASPMVFDGRVSSTPSTRTCASEPTTIARERPTVSVPKMPSSAAGDPPSAGATVIARRRRESPPVPSFNRSLPSGPIDAWAGRVPLP